MFLHKCLDICTVLTFNWRSVKATNWLTDTEIKAIIYFIQNCNKTRKKKMGPRPKRKAPACDEEVGGKNSRLEDGLTWRNVGGSSDTGACIALVSDTLEGKAKVVGFDIDFTIIKTASGKTFPTGPNDWLMWDDSVPKKLKELHEAGNRIVFFTNQAGIEKKKLTPKSFQNKLDDIIKELGVPVLVFASTGENQFRKPSTCMWDLFAEKFNNGVQVDKDKSLYVGDAAGRPKGWAPGAKKDFSCSDRMFAANVGIDFKTPEEFFLKKGAVEFSWGSLNPLEFLKTNPVLDESDDTTYASKTQELVLMVGPPASGKSTFSQRYFKPHGYELVNRDTLKTAEKCLKVAKECIASGKSVVVDNTNPAASARAPFVKLAKDKKIPCRCLWLQTSFDLAHHLNMMRQTQTQGKSRRVPDVGYNVFKKNFEEPKDSEGFIVTKIDFKPLFEKKTDEVLFKHWTV